MFRVKNPTGNWILVCVQQRGKSLDDLNAHALPYLPQHQRMHAERVMPCAQQQLAAGPEDWVPLCAKN